MPAVHRFFEQIAAADPANDTLASYILESGVPTAMAGELPPLKRYFILKVNRQLQNLTVGHRFFEQIAAADPANDTLASYILESGVPTAMAGELPPLKRYFILKVNRQLQNLTVGKDGFAEFKKIAREQNLDDLFKRVEPQIREGMSKMDEGLSQEFDTNFAMEISQMVPLAPHYEEESAIAFSVFVNYEVAAEGVKETNIVAATSTYLNAAGRVLLVLSS